MGKNTGWKGGLVILDIAPADVKKRCRRGVIRPEDAAWGGRRVGLQWVRITRQQLAERFQELGSNVGMIQDALYKDLVTKLTPTAQDRCAEASVAAMTDCGRYNRFLFDKHHARLMMESTCGV